MKYIQNSKGANILMEFRITYSYGNTLLNGKIVSSEKVGRRVNFTIAMFNSIEDCLNNYTPFLEHLTVITDEVITEENIFDIVSKRIQGEIKEIKIEG